MKIIYIVIDHKVIEQISHFNYLEQEKNMSIKIRAVHGWTCSVTLTYERPKD